MRIAACATLLFAFAACATTETSDSPYQQPNSLMDGEITRRVEQIPFQHRDELLQNLLWMAQTGEQTIPALLDGLRHENAKTRSSCAWVLGRLKDRRTIPNLQQAMRDTDQTVRMECARTLVLLGDLAWSPNLIEGLDSDRKEVRYMCHEALKTATGHDFGYDHLNQNVAELKGSVLRWRQWWSEYSGDDFFAQSYMQKHGLQAQPAMPMGEQKPMEQPMPMPTTDGNNPSIVPPIEPQPSGEPQPNGTSNGSEPQPNGNPSGSENPTPSPSPIRPNGSK